MDGSPVCKVDQMEAAGAGDGADGSVDGGSVGVGAGDISKVCRLGQPSKAFRPSVVRVAGRVMVVRLLQPKKVAFPREVREAGRVMVARLLQR
jgi:hypothetical protein